MDRKLIALLGLMTVAEIDAETVLLYLLKKRCKELKRVRKSSKNKFRSFNSKSALSQAPNNSDSCEDHFDSSDEENLSSDCSLTSDEDVDNVPTEKVMIKSELQNNLESNNQKNSENQISEDSDDSLFSESDFVANSSEKVFIKEEPNDAEELSTSDINNPHVKIESEEMIIDDCVSNKVLFESSGSNSDKQHLFPSAFGQNEETSFNQNARLGSLVAFSLKSLKHKESKERLEKLIQKAIKDVTEEDTRQ